MLENKTDDIVLDKNSDKGRRVIFQAVVAKTIGIKYLDINIKKSILLIKMKNEEYGYICVRGVRPTGNKHGEAFRFPSFKGKRFIECNTYFLLGFDKEWKNIYNVHVVPNKDWATSLMVFSIYTNSHDSKYNAFKKDTIEYNGNYLDLMSFIGNKNIFWIREIREWLNR